MIVPKPVEVVVVYDVSCPTCSAIARELPELLRVRVTVRSCRDPGLAATHPTLPVSVASCSRPAIGTVGPDRSVRWWLGLTGAVAILPVVRPARLREAVVLLWSAFGARR